MALFSKDRALELFGSEAVEPELTQSEQLLHDALIGALLSQVQRDAEDGSHTTSGHLSCGGSGRL